MVGEWYVDPGLIKLYGFLQMVVLFVVLFVLCMALWLFAVGLFPCIVCCLTVVFDGSCLVL